MIINNQKVTVSKPFKSLQNWLHKYGNYDIQADYSKFCYVTGKRSSYHPCGPASYLCSNEDKCRQYLKFLQEIRNTGDIITVTKVHFLEDSGRYNGRGEDMESEWEGYEEFHYRVQICTKTTHKVKGTIELYG